MLCYLQCKQCGATFAEDKGVYRCPEYGSKLTVRYSEIPGANNIADWVDTTKSGTWKFWRLLPVRDPKKVISLVAPIEGYGGEALGAISITGLKRELDDQKRLRRCSTRLRSRQL